MKILVPIFNFSKAGGMRVLSKLCNKWVEMGHEVTILTYYINTEPYYPINCKVIFIDEMGKETNNNNQKDNNRTGLKRMSGIIRYLKKYSSEYDVILANYNLIAWAVFLGSKKNNYYYIQAYEPEFYMGKSIRNIVLKNLAWLTYLLPFKRIVNADIYKRYKNIKSKHVIPPGIDFKDYYPKELSVEKKNSFVVGCIGRKAEWKGANDVGEAVKILHDKGLDIKLKVAFHPIKYQNFDLVQPHGDKNLADYYRSLDVLVAPGHIQLGAVHYPVIEAMACNVPVITTGYYPANDKNSFIVPIKNPEKIAEAIEKIYNNYTIALKKSEVAKEDIVQFDWDIVSENFIKIFKENRS